MVPVSAKFSVGQLVQHALFNYPVFENDDDWYEQVALSRPPKDKPWYRVLVHNTVHETYVAERNLQTDNSTEAINHPMVNSYFDEFSEGRYSMQRQFN